MRHSDGNTIVLIGAGEVGVAYAYAIVNQGLCDRLVIIDIDERRAWGHVQDLRHAVPWAGHQVTVTTGTYDDCADATLVCICAGSAQKPGETRLDLVDRNVAIFRDIVSRVTATGFDGVYLVATNPVDILSYATWRFSGLPANQVIGSGTILDTARFRSALGEYFDVAPTSVHAYVVGEHGDTELPVLSAGTAAGIPLRTRLAQSPTGEQDVTEIFERTRDAAYEIIDAKGSTSFGIGTGLARITRAVLQNEDVVLPVSALLDGEYGQTDMYIGTPAVINRHGVRQVVELDLDDTERERFTRSAETLRRVMDAAGLGETAGE
ncbi:L-lactate dehydrogenase [Corynebacterium bovis]|uniref:L-lactate dehydrogenase n=1 Tax=Corynebacterium bovis TaxID=36808 RepID=UPI00264BF2E1|nr:L-lactate dehydrogenase [Corynebacterium bovis]MDN8578919.1 L-lactate dehydrogenase [Corynebacterium bovis]